MMDRLDKLGDCYNLKMPSWETSWQGDIDPKGHASIVQRLVNNRLSNEISAASVTTCFRVVFWGVRS